MKKAISSLFAVIGLAATAAGSTPSVQCAGSACGGSGATRYGFAVVAGDDPLVEFAIATSDLELAHYTNLQVPPGWQVAVLPAGLGHDFGMFTPDGEISAVYGYLDTPARVRWWTDDPFFAVESFTFGFDHPWPPENADWKLVACQAGPPPQYFTYQADWGAPLGAGAGPVHGPTGAPSGLRLGAETLIQAGGADIAVWGYSIPSFVPWDGDALPDLVVGEGGSGYPGKVRVYPNMGQPGAPQFGDFFYVQADGADLEVPAAGCQGAFPRVVYWDGDSRKDLLLGLADGTVQIFLNTGTDAEPVFAAGQTLEFGEPGAKVPISVYARAAPIAADWNSDGRKDLVVGSVDGLIYLFLNEGTDTEPDFRAASFVELGDSVLTVLTGRSSPVVADLDGDGLADLLAGNREGLILFCHNYGVPGQPKFLNHSLAWAGGLPIDLAGQPRTRPFVCDWNADGLADLLLGIVDGKVHLYLGQYAAGDLNCDGQVDALDIDPFVLALVDAAAYAAKYPDCGVALADISGDGKVDAFDIDPFVELLTRSAPHP